MGPEVRGHSSADGPNHVRATPTSFVKKLWRTRRLALHTLPDAATAPTRPSPEWHRAKCPLRIGTKISLQRTNADFNHASPGLFLCGVYCSEGNIHGTRSVVPSAPHRTLAIRLSIDGGRAVEAAGHAEGLGNGTPTISHYSTGSSSVYVV